MTKLTQAKQSERDDAITLLRAILSPGQTVYCLLRRVSASGMSRDISFYTLDDGSMRFLDGLMSKALGMTRSKRDGLKVQGMRNGYGVCDGVQPRTDVVPGGVWGRLPRVQGTRTESRRDCA